MFVPKRGYEGKAPIDEFFACAFLSSRYGEYVRCFMKEITHFFHRMNIKPLFSRLFSMIGVSTFLFTPAYTFAADANIQLYAPSANEHLGDPFIIEGSGRVFENVLQFRLRDSFVTVIAQGSATAQSPDVGRFGPFTIRVPLPTPIPSNGMVEVFTYSARDGSVENLVQANVSFATETELAETRPFYRFYQTTNGMHFYTTDPDQRQTALQLRYRDEGTAGWMYRYSASDRIPLYHLYKAGTRDHFYTTNITEKNVAINRFGYKLERIEGYVYPSQTMERIPLYRLYNPRTQRHFYTNNPIEVSLAVSRYGFRNEGIAAYLPRR